MSHKQCGVEQSAVQLALLQGLTVEGTRRSSSPGCLALHGGGAVRGVPVRSHGAVLLLLLLLLLLPLLDKEKMNEEAAECESSL